MTNWRARARLLAFACVAGLALAGCGDDDGGDGQNDGTNGDSADQSGDGEELSPLEEYLGENSGLISGGAVTMAVSAAEMDEDERQKLRQVEELVAACMEEAGFEYIPVDPMAGDTGEDPFAEAYALPPDEFAREYGYGYTTLMNPEKEQEWVDPNQEIRDGLSEGALEEYYRVLWGDGVEVADGGGGVAISPQEGASGAPQAPLQQGCHGEARAEVYGEDDGMMMGPDMSEFEGLFEDLDALRQRIESDPRITEAAEEWAACMAEAGYSEFEGPDDPESAVMDRLSELYGWDDEAPTDAPEEDEPSVSIGGEGGELPEIDEAALAELQEYEIAVATADYECEQDGFGEVRREVAWGFEEEFVEQHRDELERYRDAMAEGPAGNAGGVG
ncbi:hypothetical protein [Jiangella anatolica]|uniref:Uncharacterized protein n=1 Tax=Jiangella anatolica TaxID=2670374 RepID=A0A2W2BKV7_9ACTN|nr:hypothetical protein [Jiangella anatolica]PZF80958.1 hypothetical protein C1I92_23250 [Jiangella anatolica]